MVTNKACDEFFRRFEATDWDASMSACNTPMVVKLEEVVDGITNELFPLRSVRRRSNDPVWMTDGIRDLSKRKKATYKREGKSERWMELDKLIVNASEKSILAIVERMKANGPRSFFSTIKSLSSPDQPDEWSVADLFLGLPPIQAGNKAAAYFTAIADKFRQLSDDGTVPTTKRRVITVDEITKRIAASNKPNSMVPGDIMPRLVKRNYKAMAIPATLIYNEVFNQFHWPEQWKVESTVIIPKVPNPSSLAECHNISCTV